MEWIIFLGLVVSLFTLDFWIFAKRPDTLKNHVFETLFFVFFGLLFSGYIWYLDGPQLSYEYLTCYIVEKAMSLDNLFVISTIFAYFSIPGKYQHRVLFWGIIGVIFFRGILIFFGVALINQFSWLNYIFAAILLWTAWKMWTTTEEDNVEYEATWVVRQIKHILPTRKSKNGEFFGRDTTHTDGTGKSMMYASSLFVALMVVETTDVMFAFDSIPTTLTITKDFYVAFTSNIMAVLGLRALFFVVEHIKNAFIHVEKSIIFILVFIGIKIFGEHFFHIPISVSLGVIALSLTTGVLASVYLPAKEEA